MRNYLIGSLLSELKHPRTQRLFVNYIYTHELDNMRETQQSIYGNNWYCVYKNNQYMEIIDIVFIEMYLFNVYTNRSQF